MNSPSTGYCLEADYLFTMSNRVRDTRCEGIHTRLSLIAGLFAPNINFWAAVVKSARPAMGRYS